MPVFAIWIKYALAVAASSGFRYAVKQIENTRAAVISLT
jgi:hypothetical protein